MLSEETSLSLFGKGFAHYLLCKGGSDEVTLCLSPLCLLSVSLGAESAAARSTHCRTFSFCKILTEGMLEQTGIREQNAAKARSRVAFLFASLSPETMPKTTVVCEHRQRKLTLEKTRIVRKDCCSYRRLLIALQDARLPAHE